jgi:hypothetical protein
MKMLRGKPSLFEICAYAIGIMLAGLFAAHHMNGQEKAVAKATEVSQIKTWKLPEYMRENLQHELDDFNKRFNEKVEAYKKELKTRFVEFKDMPDDTVLYLEGGIFITRSDFSKLQEQLRDKPMKEVKGDDKTIN